MTSWLFECVCVQEDDPQDVFPSNSINESMRSSASKKHKSRRVDSMIIYTGAEGSKDFIDDGSYDGDNFSETQSNFGYESSDVGGLEFFVIINSLILFLYLLLLFNDFMFLRSKFMELASRNATS